MTHEIGRMTSSKQPPAGHNKFYFLKVNIIDCYYAKFQVWIIFSFQKYKRGGRMELLHPLGRMTPLTVPG